jgi:hypothetical protein
MNRTETIPSRPELPARRRFPPVLAVLMALGGAVTLLAIPGLVRYLTESSVEPTQVGVSRTPNGDVDAWFVGCGYEPQSISLRLDGSEGASLWLILREDAHHFPVRTRVGSTIPGYVTTIALAEPLGPEARYLMYFGGGEAWGESFTFTPTSLPLGSVLDFTGVVVPIPEFTDRPCPDR